MAAPHSCPTGIAAYHSRRLGVELPDDRCWVCGRIDRLHRAHIIAGGPGNAANLLLLCQSCHVRQEGRNPDEVDAWILASMASGYVEMPPWYVDHVSGQKQHAPILKAIVDRFGPNVAWKIVATTWKRPRRKGAN